MSVSAVAEGRRSPVAAARTRADERIARLNNLSVGRGKDAYADIQWDAPEMQVSASDSRLHIPAFDPLAGSEWYRSLGDEMRARAGAWKFASSLKVGWHFENLMQQSLLHRALYLTDRSTEFRYVYHEVIEESQHTLMFSEVVRRLGLPVRGAPWFVRRISEILTPTVAKHASPAFFVLVLCGEEPVDRYQRLALAEGIPHPLLETVIRIHVAEEARHVSFARASLERDVAQLGWCRRQLLGIHAAISFALMTRMMLLPPKEMARDLGVSRRTLLAPYRTPAGRAFLADAVARPRALLRELGVLRGPAGWLWRALGLGPA
jgi:P-aminobenzoate N-oxygenase AurF